MTETGCRLRRRTTNIHINSKSKKEKKKLLKKKLFI